MGTLTAHIVLGIYLVVLGMRHLICSLRSYNRSPREYTASVWEPFSRGRLKHLELYLHLIFLPLAMAYELLATTDMRALMTVGATVYRVVDFQHVALLLAFWVLAAAALISDTTFWLPSSISAEAQFLIASASFATEWMVLSREGEGIEGKCNALLSNLAAICAASCLALAFNPRMLIAHLVLCEGILLQGSWVVQAGISVYVKRFIPEGCHRMLDLPSGIDGATRCDLDESRARAMAIMDLAFILHVISGIVMGMLVCCIVGQEKHKQRRNSNGSYDPLSTSSSSSVDVVDVESSIPMKPIKQAQF